MIDFGYGISPSSAINLDTADKSLYEAVCGIEPDIAKCMACGSCAASCSASPYGDMNLRRCILLLSRGRNDDALAMMRHCMLCGKCILVCPRGINTRHLILSVIKTASKK